MRHDNNPYRSILYVPASNEKACQKAKKLPVDGLIFDLEDSVVPNKKDSAREYLSKLLSSSTVYKSIDLDIGFAKNTLKNKFHQFWTKLWDSTHFQGSVFDKEPLFVMVSASV